MDGVTLTPLKIIEHEKGNILHALKCSEATFSQFGEAYFSSVNPGEIKGWKQHTKAQLNLIVPQGKVRFVIHNGVEFEQIDLSLRNYCRLTVEPGLWVAFACLGSESNLILNLCSLSHEPSEAINKPLDEIQYNWEL